MAGKYLSARRLRVYLGFAVLCIASLGFGASCQSCDENDKQACDPSSEEAPDFPFVEEFFSADLIDEGSDLVDRSLSLAHGPQAETALYGDRQLLAGDARTRGIAVGDLNGDGLDDVVLANEGEQNVVYFGNRTASPDRVVFGSASGDSVAVALGDLDRDGHLDIVIANNGQRNKWYRNDGTTSPFGADAVGLDIGSEEGATNDVVVEDFDRDGQPDVFVGNIGNSGVYLGGNGEGSSAFSSSSELQSFGSWPTRAVAAADFNGDGYIDIALGNEGQADRWYTNAKVIGAPFLGPGVTEHRIGVMTSDDADTFGMAVGDFNSDGKIDIATANAAHGAAWYANSGQGFADSSRRRVGEVEGLVFDVVAFDQDLDGHDDLLVNNSVTGNRWFSRAAGSGTPIGTAAQGSWTAAVGDIDGDRAIDIITGDPLAATPNAWYGGSIAAVGTVSSKNVNENNVDFGRTVTFDWTVTDSSDGVSGAHASLSNDGADTWHSVTPGQAYTFPTEGRDLRWRVDLWHRGGDRFFEIFEVELSTPALPTPTPVPPVSVKGALESVPGVERVFGVLGGDPDASGEFDITVDPNTSVACYTLEVENLGSPTVADLIDADGNSVQVDLTEYESGQCWTLLPSAASDLPPLPFELLAVADAYLSAPEQADGGSGFSVEIKTDEFPDGAIRGDLPVAPTPTAGNPDPDVPRAVCFGRTVTVNIANGDVPTDGHDVILGTPGDDLIAGGDGHDLICGLGGDDVIWGQNGNDTILGQAGDDKLRGGSGDDFLYGGADADDLNGGSGDDRVYGEAGDDPSVRGGTGDDIVDGGDGNDGLVNGNGGTDMVYGGAGDDPKVNGGPRPDTVNGGPGDDGIKGNKGADTLIGGPGNDDIRGGPQPDAIDGGTGTDICNGGTTGEGAPETDTAVNCSTVTQVP